MAKCEGQFSTCAKSMNLRGNSEEGPEGLRYSPRPIVSDSDPLFWLNCFWQWGGNGAGGNFKMLQAINPKMLRGITVSGFRDGKLDAKSWE